MNLPIGEILFLVVLTLLEAFFVAAEIALVSIRRSRVEQLVDEGRPGARRVQKLLERSRPVPRRVASSASRSSASSPRRTRP